MQKDGDENCMSSCYFVSSSRETYSHWSDFYKAFYSYISVLIVSWSITLGFANKSQSIAFGQYPVLTHRPLQVISPIMIDHRPLESSMRSCSSLLRPLALCGTGNRDLGLGVRSKRRLRRSPRPLPTQATPPKYNQQWRIFLRMQLLFCGEQGCDLVLNFIRTMLPY
jgi:hypothetical protein